MSDAELIELIFGTYAETGKTEQGERPVIDTAHLEGIVNMTREHDSHKWMLHDKGVELIKREERAKVKAECIEAVEKLDQYDKYVIQDGDQYLDKFVKRAELIKALNEV